MRRQKNREERAPSSPALFHYSQNSSLYKRPGDFHLIGVHAERPRSGKRQFCSICGRRLIYGFAPESSLGGFSPDRRRSYRAQRYAGIRTDPVLQSDYRSDTYEGKIDRLSQCKFGVGLPCPLRGLGNADLPDQFIGFEHRGTGSRCGEELTSRESFLCRNDCSLQSHESYRQIGGADCRAPAVNAPLRFGLDFRRTEARDIFACQAPDPFIGRQLQSFDASNVSERGLGILRLNLDQFGLGPAAQQPLDLAGNFMCGSHSLDHCGWPFNHISPGKNSLFRSQGQRIGRLPDSNDNAVTL